jgi:hypothetical protein
MLNIIGVSGVVQSWTINKLTVDFEESLQLKVQENNLAVVG